MLSCLVTVKSISIGDSKEVHEDNVNAGLDIDQKKTGYKMLSKRGKNRKWGSSLLILLSQQLLTVVRHSNNYQLLIVNLIVNIL